MSASPSWSVASSETGIRLSSHVGVDAGEFGTRTHTQPVPLRARVVHSDRRGGRGSGQEPLNNGPAWSISLPSSGAPSFPPRYPPLSEGREEGAFVLRILAAVLLSLATGCVTINANQPPPPVAEEQQPPSAVCRDGTYSYSAHRSGTCSYHGGVAQWLVDLPP